MTKDNDMEKDFLTDLIITGIHSTTTIYNEAGTRNRKLCRPNCGVLIKYSGETEYTCRGEKYISNKDNIIILPKGSAYEWVCTKSGHCAILDFDCNKTHDKILCIPVNNGEKYLKLLKEVEYKRTVRNPLYEMECIRDTYDILLKLQQAESYYAYHPASKFNKIQPAVDYIALNYNKNITNDELAALTSLSTVYFRKLFTELYGMSPITYVHTLRIKKATEMLQSDYGSITNIAQSLGYSTIYDFSRTFKKYMRVSPSNYLKSGKKPVE